MITHIFGTKLRHSMYKTEQNKLETLYRKNLINDSSMGHSQEGTKCLCGHMTHIITYSFLQQQSVSLRLW